MILRLLMTSIMIIVFPLSISSAAAKLTAQVAVLPFEVYSNVSTEYLRNTIARELSSQIATEEQITIVDQATVKSLLDNEPPLNFNEDALRRISEKLNAHFLVLGSLTRISENLSLDVYLFNSLGSPPFSKDFTEGRELNSLIRKMARKINTKVLLMASNYPELKGPEFIEEVSLKEAEEEKPALDVKPPLSTAVSIEKEEGAASQIVPEGKVREETLVEQVLEDKAEEKESEETVVSMLPKTDLREVVKQPKDVLKEESKKKPTSSPFTSDRPIKITSKTLEADNKRNVVIFKGDVVAKQGDMVIFSDIMRVKYRDKGGIRKVEATGNVKMTQEDRIATGQKVVFYNPEQKIVMTGKPRIWQGDNLISCKKVTVLLKEDKIFFEGKVDSTIYPKNVKESEESTQQVEMIAPPPERKVVKVKEEPTLKEMASLEGVKTAEEETTRKFISDWKQYWENKDLENYMRCYSKEFTSKGMDWYKWKTYKKYLNDRYHRISLSFDDVRITLKENQALVSFKQYYQSDNYSDYGMKSLMLKKENGDWKIYAEKWEPL